MDHESDFHLPLVTGGCPLGRVGLWPTYGTLKTWLPILGWLPKYRYSWLQLDLIAGFTVGLTTVPQALAYAEVVGLPPQVRAAAPCATFVNDRRIVDGRSARDLDLNTSFSVQVRKNTVLYFKS